MDAKMKGYLITFGIALAALYAANNFASISKIVAKKA